MITVDVSITRNCFTSAVYCCQVKQDMTNSCEARIACSRQTRQLVKSKKRGGESYDELLRKMTEQYDPSENLEVEL